jgi:hypothetical protein
MLNNSNCMHDYVEYANVKGAGDSGLLQYQQHCVRVGGSGVHPLGM